MSNSLINDRIEALKGKLSSLEQQRLGIEIQIKVLKGQIVAYEDAENLTRAPRPGGNKPEAPAQPKAQANGHHPGQFQQTDFGRKWNEALSMLRTRRRKFTTDDILQTMAAIGHEVPRVRARARLAEAVKKGALIRIEEGVFDFPAGTVSA